MTNEIFIAFEKSLKGEFVSANETKRRKGRKSCAQVWLNASNNGMEGWAGRGKEEIGERIGEEVEAKEGRAKRKERGQRPVGPPNIPTVPARGQTSARMLFDAPRSCVMRATSREIYIFREKKREIYRNEWKKRRVMKSIWNINNTLSSIFSARSTSPTTCSQLTFLRIHRSQRVSRYIPFYPSNLR